MRKTIIGSFFLLLISFYSCKDEPKVYEYTLKDGEDGIVAQDAKDVFFKLEYLHVYPVRADSLRPNINRIYIQFPLKKSIIGAEIDSSFLYLKTLDENSFLGNNSCNIFLVDEYDEGINWDNQPDVLSKSKAKLKTTAKDGVLHRVDITELVKEASKRKLENLPLTVRLKYEDQKERVVAAFNSSRAETNQPKLEIYYHQK